MLPRDNLNLADTDALSAEIDRLVGVETTESPFLSCYLDARSGKDACKAFVEEAAASVRGALEVVSRFEFDNAFNMVMDQLDGSLEPRVGGLALFARGIAGGRFVSALRFATPVDNSLTWYRAPEIVPLLALRERASRFTMLMVRGSGTQVMDVDLDGARPVVWAAFPPVSPPRTAARGCAISLFDRQSRTIRRAIGARSGIPLVVAGDRERVDRAVACLPGRVRARCVDGIALSDSLTEHDFLERVREHWVANRSLESTRFATRLLRVLRPQGNAVAGPVATEQALREGNVETLVISEAPCEVPDRRWDARIELSRLAWRQGIPIIASESSELQYLGGVGCVLRSRAGRRILPVPANGLQQVA